MTAPNGPPRVGSWRSIALGAVVWGLALLGVLSLAQAPGDWGHALCGPWGCTPPAQALLACHLAWLLAVAPLAWMLSCGRVLSDLSRRRIGALLCGAAIAALGLFVLHERLVWWPAVSEATRGYFWQRCGFAVVTSVEIPVLQTLLAGSYLLLDRMSLGGWLGARVAAIRLAQRGR